MKKKFLIIGAGPTGLGAAYKLKDLGEQDYLIVERNEWIGGLASSFQDPQGFWWDIGGHVQFSHYDYFDRAMDVAIDPKDWLHHQRECWVWMKERFVPYPFQNNIRFLPKESMLNCLNGLVDVATNPAKEKPTNFKEWIIASFGQGIADEFMVPYNYKVWAYPPEDMNFHWIGERVATVDLKRILKNIVNETMDASWGPNNMFKFPGEGGTGAIWRSIGAYVGLDKIKLKTEVLEVDPRAKTAKLSDGTTVQYEQILSTMPVDIFTSMVKGTTPGLRNRARELKHSTSNIIGVGLKGKPDPRLATKCWMYFPEESVPFYRMTVFSNYSPRNVPDPTQHYSLMCEVSESPKKVVQRDALIEQTIQGLKSNGLVPADNEIVSTWMYSAEYGYPTPSVDRDPILFDVITELDSMRAYSRGRFGGWKYEVSNQDHSFMQGVEWVDWMVNDVEEKTYRVDTSRDPNLTVLKKSA